MRRILSTAGLGILGIDPVTAMYIMGMGLRKEKKSHISLFMLTFAGLSILQGAVLATVFGAAAADVIKEITPDDDSMFWVALEFAISVIIIVWLAMRFVKAREKKEDGKKQLINGSAIKFIGVGILFALSCFTDPTYYGVILLGGETRNFLYSLLLMSIWLLVSQFMSFIAYAANQLNLLHKLSDAVERFRERYSKGLKNALYSLLGVIALYLLVDSALFVFTGNYLF